ncbi:MAG: hypothetical protein EZS28_013323 [Streblomastix strix]|uniref:Uncharacterized protein n=1 Tax=Streblomastix strix TaxID=222440 RepID=A0A5J4W9V0_9EUKA|nr:MAG: hypothetical protein EZS28_013323 [Streblomastix strix]
MAGKKQQARPALKNKPKNQKQQQNRRYYQPQAHKERLKDQKQPIVQTQPVIKPILGPQLRQIPKPQAQQAVKKQAPRALPKNFVKQQQTAKKQREKLVQPIRIVNTQQKYARKRRKHYQIKSQQKQEEGEFRNLEQRLEQEFSMQMMEQEQLQARFQRFESGLLPQERDILIRNRLEIQRMNQQYSDRDIQEFAYDNQQFILLTQPARYYLLSQVLEDKRAHYASETINYIAGTEITSPKVEFFNNNITSPED